LHFIHHRLELNVEVVLTIFVICPVTDF